MNDEKPDDSAIAETLNEVARLATLPEVTTRILETVDDPDATAETLESLISSDPVLSARVLKVVNSSFYGMPATVDSIKQAVVMLGLGGVKNIALAASFAKLFGGRQKLGNIDPQGAWKHSTAVGATAKLISRHVGGDGDVLFLAGLLHDVGTLLLMQARRPQYLSFLKAQDGAEGKNSAEAETRIFGATHEQFGAALCRKWNFPRLIQDAVEYHHNPDALEGDSRRTAQIIRLADYLAAEANIGYCCVALDDSLESQLADDVGLSEEALNEVRAHLPEATQLAEQFAA